jgi:hypothetical protein
MLRRLRRLALSPRVRESVVDEAIPAVEEVGVEVVVLIESSGHDGSEGRRAEQL